MNHTYGLILYLNIHMLICFIISLGNTDIESPFNDESPVYFVALSFGQNRISQNYPLRGEETFQQHHYEFH